MALLRKHLYPSTTYLCLSVPTCAGIRDGHRAATLSPSLVWRVAECGSTGCGALLGAARVAASELGDVRCVHRSGSLPLQLLDEYVLGRGSDRNRRCAADWSLGSHLPCNAIAL